MSRDKKKSILITGVTGFLGKVVLEELIRRKDELSIKEFILLIRPGKDRSALDRFHLEFKNSQCFTGLPKNWPDFCKVISSELTQNNCGLAMSDKQLIIANVTHIIHCAASISFDLPLQKAAEANIKSALNISDIADQCKWLSAFVSVSTAYVTPLQSKIPEQLVPLKKTAVELYEQILSGDFDEKAILAESGHANTYTYTKCLAEHLLMNNSKSSLKIVRPSIISASWKYPFPGWIDSAAAFAGFVKFVGSGYFTVLKGDPNTLVDVVPVDEVSHQIISACFEADPKKSIRHAVCGLKNSNKVDDCFDATVKSFSKYPFAKRPEKKLITTDDFKFKMAEWQHHILPSKASLLLSQIFRDTKAQKKISRLASQRQYLNSGFSYFSHNTFNFQQKRAMKIEDFDKEKYMDIINFGVGQFLIGNDPSQTRLMGKLKNEQISDVLWALKQPNGNIVHRGFGFAIKKAARLCLDEVTFDAPSFHQARKSVGETPIIYVSTHRSYFDFLVWPFLFFSHPELGFRLPFIAAAKEFSDLALLGRLFKFCNAFYINRGKGKEDKELSQKIKDFTKEKKPILFFVEGTRSRFGNFLEPKRGLLRAFQNTGQTYKVIPLSISYDRRPEDAALLQEMKGEPKSQMKMISLLKWSFDLIKGNSNIGRIHLKCGNPIELNTDTNIQKLANEIMAVLVKNAVTSEFQISHFAKHFARTVGINDIKAALKNRGGQVFASTSPTQPDLHKLDSYLVLAMTYNWRHLFYPDAILAFPDNFAVQNHVYLNSYQQHSEVNSFIKSEPYLQTIVSGLFEPVCKGYEAIARIIFSFSDRDVFSHFELTNEKNLYQPFINEVIKDLVSRKIIQFVDGHKDQYAWGLRKFFLIEYINKVKWSDTNESSLIIKTKNLKTKQNSSSDYRTDPK